MSKNITLDNLVYKLEYKGDRRLNFVKAEYFCGNKISLKRLVL